MMVRIPRHVYECVDLEHVPQIEQPIRCSFLHGCVFGQGVNQNRVILGTNKRVHQTRVQVLTQRQAFVLNRTVMPLNARMTPCLLLQQSYQRLERF
jgi:hypothetical protein